MCFRPPTAEMDKNLCPKCGAEAMLGARKCTQCGTTLVQDVAASETPEAHGAPGTPGAPKPGAPKASSVPQPSKTGL